MENFDGLSPAEIEEALRTRPGIEPPDGQVSLFDDPPTRNEIVIVVMTIGVLLAAVAVSLRLYSKIRVTKAFRLEDCMSLAPYRTDQGQHGKTTLLTNWIYRDRPRF